MNSAPAVSREVAEALFRKLSGFRGYPAAGPGEQFFIDTFQMACISVAHAQAVIEVFDETMPTKREIRDAAFNLRPKFERPSPALKEQWERESGPPQPFDVTVPKVERRVDELWRLLRHKFPGCGRPGKPWPSWMVLAKAARELGYEDYARAWENSLVR